MKMKKQQKNNNTIKVVILATIFGLAAGVVGSMFIGAGPFDSLYSAPFFGEINFSDGKFSGSNLIIRDAKKVIVEQDTKVDETINSVSTSMVGIFKKKEIKASQGSKFNPDNYYQLDQEIGQGLIITSDGWIMTSLFIEDARSDIVISDYIVITKDREIYTIDKFAPDPKTPFSFIHVEGARDLPVRSFAADNEITSGKFVIVSSWEGKNFLTHITGRKDIEALLVKSSDSFFDELVLTDDLSQDFAMSVIFDLGGNIAGLVDKEGKARPISHFSSAINSLLKYKEIKRPGLGINYIDLSQLASDDFENNKGAIIYENASGVSVTQESPAQIAGLREGDIITSIDNTQLDQNNNLTYSIQSYLPGDKINIAFSRNGLEREVEVELGEAE